VATSFEIEDLTTLTHLHEPEILHALELRYHEDLIYTATGPILIALNPFKRLPIYSERRVDRAPPPEGWVWREGRAQPHLVPPTAGIPAARC